MTDVDLGLIATIIMFSAVITVCISFYVAHACTENFEHCLPSCKFVEQNKKVFSSAGLLRKIMRCNMICFYLWIPSIGEKRGLVDIKEIERFPAEFKYLLAIIWAVQIIIVIALALLIQLSAP